MNTLRASILAAGLSAIAFSASADQHQRAASLYEVEVSLWELVASALYHIGDPDACGTILGGTEPDTTPTDEFKKQLDDVERHLGDYKEAATNQERPAISDFEVAYATFVSEAERAMALSSSSDGTTDAVRAQTLKMWLAAHRADDIIDSRLQSGNDR